MEGYFKATVHNSEFVVSDSSKTGFLFLIDGYWKPEAFMKKN